MEQDIRWKQRFSNFLKALKKLEEAVTLIIEKNDSSDILNEIIKEGLIQRFEYTHELAWNVMKDYAEYQGNFNIKGSRDATQEAFKINLIKNGEVWMDMIKSRNKTSHTYNNSVTEEICLKIVSEYLNEFKFFSNEMAKLN